MLSLQRFFPDFAKLAIHESSPSGGGASARIAAQCPGYVASQRFPDVPLGGFRDGVRCEDLEQLRFRDGEIARTLRPGGAHLLTVPLVRRQQPSFVRAERAADGQILHHAEPSYHGNPIDPNGSLVTVDWGYDICEHIHRASGMFTKIVEIDDLEHGIRADLIEVLVSYKPPG